MLLKAKQHQIWTVAEQICLGEKNGMISFNVAENSFSSSVLEILETSIAAEASTSYVRKETVLMRRLDDWILERPELAGQRFALKMDVQGYEDKVLAGAARAVRQVEVVFLEMSLVPLYAGAPSFRQLFGAIEDLGFGCAGIFRASQTNRP